MQVRRCAHGGCTVAESYTSLNHWIVCLRHLFQSSAKQNELHAHSNCVIHTSPLLVYLGVTLEVIPKLFRRIYIPTPLREHDELPAKFQVLQTKRPRPNPRASQISTASTRFSCPLRFGWKKKETGKKKTHSLSVNSYGFNHRSAISFLYPCLVEPREQPR